MGAEKRAVYTARRLIAKETPYFLRYAGVGLVNTILGYGIIFGFMACGGNPYHSNAVGYGIGIACSYILNKRFSFRSSAPNPTAPFFLGSLGVTFLANPRFLMVPLKYSAVNAYLAQILAGGVYTLVGFVAAVTSFFPAL